MARRAHPEDRVRVEEVRRQAFRKRQSEYDRVSHFSVPEEARWIESRSFISYNPDGAPRRVIGVNIDVTDRKRAGDQQRDWLPSSTTASRTCLRQ